MSDCGRCFEDIKQCGVVYENPGWRDSLIWEGAVQLFREKAFYAQETTTQMPTGESLLSWVQEGAGDEGLLHAQRQDMGARWQQIHQGGWALVRRVTLTDRKALEGFE